jgi:hypothetical protein
MPFSSRLLSIEQVEKTLHVMNSTYNNGAGHNYLCLLIGKFVNLVKISYMSQNANGKHKSAFSNIEHMMNSFKESNDISFISFSDVPIDECFDHAQGKSCDDLIPLTMRYSDTVTISTYRQSENNIIFRRLLTTISHGEYQK